MSMTTSYDSNGSGGGDDDGNNVAITMTAILGTMVAIVGGLTTLQTPKTSSTTPTKDDNLNVGNVGRFLPDPITEPSKRSYEIFALIYTPIWITSFGIIVAFGFYETFDEWSYMKVCVGLSLPFLLQPILLPSGGGNGSAIVSSSSSFSSPDVHRPLLERYCFKANVWIAIYSFIGNYWYTHYFYSVLKAKYTMPAHRLNNVPIALYFATHFYFSTYHVFSNMMLRKVVTSYKPTWIRHVLFLTVIIAFAYFTAFAETLTISSYPDYSFEDWNMACTIGSAFYGIYFLVSFPAFFYFDTHIDYDDDDDDSQRRNNVTTLWDTIVSSCGYGMMIMILLDIVRLYLDIPLVVGRSLDDLCDN